MALSEWEKRERREREWLDGLKEGDPVMLVTHGFHAHFQHAKVTKITKANGRTIFVGTRKFNGYGRERVSGYHGLTICEPTQEILDEIETQELRRLLRRVDLDKKVQTLPIEKLRNLKDFLSTVIFPGEIE